METSYNIQVEAVMTWSTDCQSGGADRMSDGDYRPSEGRADRNCVWLRLVVSEDREVGWLDFYLSNWLSLHPFSLSNVE